MKAIKYLLIFTLELYLVACLSTRQIIHEEFEAPNQLQIFQQPREGLKPPFVYTDQIAEDGCVFTKASIDSANAGSTYDAKIQEGLNRRFDAEFFAKLSEDAALRSRIAVELTKNLQFEIKAKGLKIYSVAPTEVEFKGGVDCINYLTSFKEKNRTLVLQTLSADTLLITVSKLQDQGLKGALEAKFRETYGANINVVDRAQGKYDFKITGSNLTFGYNSHSFMLELYSTNNSLNLKIPLNKEYLLLEKTDLKWLRACRVEPTGDDQTYIVTMYPTYGSKIFKRMSPGDQKDFSIEKHHKLTVTLSSVSDQNAELAIAGFGITFK